MQNGTWIDVLSVGTNISILIVGLKLVRHLSRIEFKVETMWSIFMKKFVNNDEDR